ncbi:MAG TPA: hypothetical protein VFA21_05295 [Pyrinomonadaceae bacterium]|jgi:uncharacterized protein (TIGR02646 family)|nr:hypothetical protein [Pyrinomonadaceae bacterium]
MIRIVKPKKPPAILTTKGRAKRDEHKAAYDSGESSFAFDAKIYGHKTVKETLKKAQHDKCFLCESKITHISHGDVEHFRPKAAYKQSASDRLCKPGYYWLAYEWSNLFLACQICNQVFKKNLFPLANPSERATSHRKKIAIEKPLFIDPSVDNPEEFISFRGEVPFPLNNHPMAKATIEGLGLKRPKLNERRLEHYERLKMLYQIAYKLPSIEESAEAKELLDKAVEDNAEYASMARSAIKAEFKLIP